VQDATVARRRVLSRGPVVVLVVLAYVGVLHYAYVRDIAPIFTYLQYGYRRPDPVVLRGGDRHGGRPRPALAAPHRAPLAHVIVWLLYLVAVLPA
jgi:hypothetical protein